MAEDTTYAYPVLFTASFVNSTFSPTPPGKKTIYYLSKTLVLLNERMSDSILSLQDSTIMAVMSLVATFSCLKEYRTAMIHIKGLGEMIRLRGGLDSLRNMARCYVKFPRLAYAPSFHVYS